MNSHIKLDEDRLHIFHEGRKRRVFVGELFYNRKKNRYEFSYNPHYVFSKSAIPVGHELSLFKLHHKSETGKLFPSLMDRLPDKSNPAYKDYCQSQGIKPEEKNLIILLGSIGKRGPSSFIFEPVFHSEFTPSKITKLREDLEITQHDLSVAFDISKPTLQRIEAGTSQDANTLKNLQILLEFPEVALWQLKQTGGRVHYTVLNKLVEHFKKLAEKREKDR
jgi:DNA-binding transcriptional regulator YiaG